MTTLTTRPLRFSPTAWAKLLRLRDLGETEVGGFGISRPGDLLLVEDVSLIRQQCTEVTVKFDDASVADFFDRQVDRCLAPEQFARIWIHTHPGSSPQPSSTDEATFARCFGNSDWAIMFILARGGQTYARLHFSAGPGGALLLPVEIDFRQPFTGSDWTAWDAEYLQSVAREAHLASPRRRPLAGRISRTTRPEATEQDPPLDAWWDQPLWGNGPLLARPFDDDFPPFPLQENDDEQLGAPF
jgi:proteasome lid subunit RPN8/RPN11